MKNLIVSKEIFDARKTSVQVDKDCKNPYYFTIKAGKLEFPFSYDYHGCGYTTKKLAEEARNKFIKENPWKNKLTLVTVNSDPIECKGRQVFDCLFEELSDAYNYILSKHDQFFHPNEDESPRIEFGMNINKELYYMIYLGIHDIQLIELNTKSDIIHI